MSPLHKATNLLAVFVPPLLIVAGAVLLWDHGLSWVDVGLFAGFYVVTCLGVTLGFHRLLTHRAYATSKPIEYALAALGSLALQGPVIAWVADHRKHHAHTDQEGDPHSPHAGFAGGGVRDTLRGLWHAHVGWLWADEGRADPSKYARDLVEDRGMVAISRLFGVFAVATIVLPGLLGWLISGSFVGFLTGALWGGIVRVFLLHHVTWSVNSVCHFLGRRPFETEDRSGNVFWLALPSLGESWHHNHHAFPRSAAHGLGRWQVDVTALAIRGLERVGLVWDVVRIAPERQAARRRAPAVVAASAEPGRAGELDGGAGALRPRVAVAEEDDVRFERL